MHGDKCECRKSVLSIRKTFAKSNSLGLKLVTSHLHLAFTILLSKFPVPEEKAWILISGLRQDVACKQ